jgi:nucleoid-associated protein YgaU
MKDLKNFTILSLLFALVFSLAAINTEAQRKPSIKRTTPQRAKNFNVPSGPRLRVRIDQTLNSKASQVGDTFTATVIEDVYSSDGVMVIPQSSKVTGRVDSVTKAKKGGNPGQIDVSFTQVKLPNGTTRRINGSLTDLDADDAKSDAEGTASGDKMKHRKIIFIGGGGAGGAVLGAAIGGGKGALIGGLIGAGAGLLGERLTKGEDAEVKSGTEFGVILNQGVSLPRFGEAAGSNDRTEYPDTNTGGSRTYVVQPGDTLGKISVRFYGTANGYLRIYEANRDQLSSPSDIRVGQELVIPE